MIVVVARIETFSDISREEKASLMAMKTKYNLPPVLHRTVAIISNDLSHGMSCIMKLQFVPGVSTTVNDR
jgi:hypothetical protein